MRRISVAVAFLLLAGGCREKKADPPPEAAKETADVVLTPGAIDAAGVIVGTPKVAPRRTAVSVTGMLEFVPNRVARVGPLIEGRVTTIRVDPGQHVTAGTVLATVESVEVGKARADYLSSQVKMQYAEQERVRQSQLADGGLTTGIALLSAQTNKDLASLESRAAAERLRAVGVRTDDLSNVDGGAAAGHPTSSMMLKTPLGGLVLDVNARVGQAVSSTDTLFVVGEIDSVWLIVDVYERDLSKVHAGDTAKAQVIAYPNRTFEGKVDYVGGIVDPVRRAVPARIVLANPDGTLRPGMSATAHIYSAAPAADAGTADVLVVPRGAIQTIDGQPFVFVEKGAGRYELRAVERGADVEGDTEVTKGLAPNERIAIEGTFILKSEALREQMGKND